MRGANARIAVLLAAAIAAAAGARAQSGPQTGQITVTGSVDRMCIMANPQVNLGASTNIGQASGGTVTIADLSDDQQMTTKSTDFYVTLSGMCNYSHLLTISSDRGGLWREPAGLATGGFANGVPYRATVDWGGSETVLLASAAGEGQVQQTLSVDQPVVGGVLLHFHIDQSATNAGSGVPLVAGNYDDTIRLTLGPQ